MPSVSNKAQSSQKIGLTGGIGSGKSTAAAVFSELGACMIDADAISRNLTATNGAAIAVIAAQFGASFIASDGSMARDKMRELIFSDRHAKQQLEGIIHPLVKQTMQAQYDAAVLVQAKLVVYDIPLLVESQHWRLSLDQVVVIDCSAETQVARVMARSKLAHSQITREAVEKIIQAQASRVQRLKAADSVICNESISLAAFCDEVTQVARGFGL